MRAPAGGEFAAVVVRGLTACHFYDTGLTEVHDIVNLRVSGASLSQLQKVSQIRYMGDHAVIDWQARVVDHGSHSDPLYEWAEGGRHWFEVEIYTQTPDQPFPFAVALCDDGPRRLPLAEHRGFTSPTREVVRSSVREVSSGRWSLALDCPYPVDFVQQVFEGGRFKESMKTLGPGRHEVVIACPPGASYFGVSLSATTDTGFEAETKHVLRGRLPGAIGR